MGKFANKSWSTIFIVDGGTTKRGLKVQYKELIKEYNRKDFPEEFAEIENAYFNALKYITGEASTNSTVETTSKDDFKHLEENIKYAENRRIKIAEKKKVFFNNVMNGILNEKAILEYFGTSNNLYLDMVEFYLVFNKRINIDTVTNIIKASSNNYVNSAWCGMLASTMVEAQKYDNLEMFNYYEKKFFNSEGEEKAENFINIVKFSKFTFPFNYLTEDIYNIIKSKYPAIYKGYINTLKSEFIFYYANPKINTEILRDLEQPKKEKFCFYALVSSKYNSAHELDYRSLYDNSKDYIRTGLIKEVNNNDISSIEDYEESTLLINYISYNHLSTIKYNDVQRFLRGENIRVEKIVPSKPTQYNNYSSSKKYNPLKVIIPVTIVGCIAIFSILNMYSVWTFDSFEKDHNDFTYGVTPAPSSINLDEEDRDAHICTNNYSDLKLELYSVENEYTLIVVGNFDNYDINNFYVGDQSLRAYTNEDYTEQILPSKITIKFTNTGSGQYIEYSDTNQCEL